MARFIKVPPGGPPESKLSVALGIFCLYAQLILGIASAVGIAYAYRVWVFVHYRR